MHSTISLDQGLLIAEGSERRCYAHPQLNDRCLKVPLDRTLGRLCPQCRVEMITSVNMQKRLVPMQHAVRSYGWVDTSMGPALMMEKVQDKHGKISLTLEQSLKAGNLTWNQVKTMLQTLRDWALEYSVVISELNVKNLMHCRGESGDRLVVIDGLGGRKPDLVFHLRQRLLWMARHKTRKRWPREYEKIRKASLNIIKGLV